VWGGGKKGGKQLSRPVKKIPPKGGNARRPFGKDDEKGEGGKAAGYTDQEAPGLRILEFIWP